MIDSGSLRGEMWDVLGGVVSSGGYEPRRRSRNKQWSSTCTNTSAHKHTQQTHTQTRTRVAVADTTYQESGMLLAISSVGLSSS